MTLAASFSELVCLFIPHVLSSSVVLYFSNTLPFLFLCLFLCFFYILLRTVNALCRRNSLPDPIGHARSTKICFLLKESYRVNKYGNVCVCPLMHKDFLRIMESLHISLVPSCLSTLL